jgi:peptide/nickel transport system permease protein
MHTRKKLLFFTFLTGMLLLLAVFAHYLTPYDPNAQMLAEALQAPSGAHILGTDRYGRDMLSRVIAGTQVSILSTLALVTIISLVGAAIGIICGYIGGTVDSVIMRISDIFLAFPGMVFAIAVAGVLGGGIINAVAALVVVSWPKYARLARSQVLVVKDSDFIKAARLSGTKGGKLILRHILPNVASILLVTAVLDIGTLMMEIAGLSFLGLGAMPPTAEWGSMMSKGRSLIQTSPWVILAPGCAIFLTVMVFNLLGDTIRDYRDPRQN